MSLASRDLALELKNVGKGFGGNRVLEGIDLQVRQGEFLSLVGMSGCGKSTLLRIIAGLEAPDSGSLKINGRDVTDVDPAERNLAMVFQSYALYPHMSVRQNIATPLRMRNLPLAARLPLIRHFAPGKRETLRQIDEAVNHAAEVLQITALLDRKPAQLSGGQRQRVALARALVRSPAAFLMDEPLSNLDAKLRAHMRDELAALHRKLETTFLYVTHDQVEAMTMSDRIALIEGGRIMQLGTPSDLYEQPANLTVARFIGTPAINLLPAEVDATGRISLMGRQLGLCSTGGGETAMLGVRAEDLRLEAGGLRARVVRIERHGADRYLTLQCADAENDRLVMRQQAGDAGVEAGDVIELGFALERAHLFGADGVRRQIARIDRVAA